MFQHLLTILLVLSASVTHADPPTKPGNLWSLQEIRDPPCPPVARADWPRNGLDSFILAKLEAERVSPSEEAPRAALVRRLFLDLTGLPPSPGEWARWTELESADWYEQLVSQLLASPHYGERWARFWLDQARYADTDGYEKDSPRPHAYRWRDWVIDALNRDLPFDEFTEQQIAGDLLPEASDETRVATGFHRNTLTNREGGIDREEDRVKQVVDRINTVSSVWLGLTVKCAQCHSHKYDPLSHQEYFGLYSFFNNADERDYTLAPSPEQTRAFDIAKRNHADELRQLTEARSLERRHIRDQLPQKLRELRQRFPNGDPTPVAGLKVHLPFEGEEDERLLNRVTQQVSKFGGAKPENFVQAKASQVLVLDGKGQHLDLGQSASFEGDQAFSFGAWVRLDLSRVGTILSKMDVRDKERGFDLTSNAGIIEVHLIHDWPSDGLKVTTTTRLPAGQWRHVFATYDGSKKAKGLSIYFDGEKQPLKIHRDQLKGTIRTKETLRIGQRTAGAFLNGQVDDVLVYDRALTPSEVKSIAGTQAREILKLASKEASQRSEAESAQLVDYFFGLDQEAISLDRSIAKLEKSAPKIQRDTAMGLVQRDSPRKTYVHLRGEFLEKGEEVTTRTPAFLHPLKVRGLEPDRLDLARWILDPANSLTPRVIVNRIWQQYFRNGLVRSSEDFGTQGDLPSHPLLLDWLASRFVEDQWSLKALHRRIVLSATYRQSARVRTELLERDPYNSWIAYRSRQRVEAEIVRDAALAVSGLLDRRIHGPSVFPPLPKGVIELAFVDVINRGPWRVSKNGDQYRRGLYTFYQRTSPYPLLSLFDAPDSNVACVRREISNTPLQALTLWNDPVFLDCARSLAARIFRDGGQSLRSRLEHAFVLTLSRRPQDSELAVLTELFEQSERAYRKEPKAATRLIADFPLAKNVEPSIFAAWIGVSRALINLDEFITRE